MHVYLYVVSKIQRNGNFAVDTVIYFLAQYLTYYITSY